MVELEPEPKDRSKLRLAGGALAAGAAFLAGRKSADCTDEIADEKRMVAFLKSRAELDEGVIERQKKVIQRLEDEKVTLEIQTKELETKNAVQTEAIKILKERIRELQQFPPIGDKEKAI